MREALRSRRRTIRRLLLSSRNQPDSRLREIEQLAHAAGVPIERVERTALDNLTNGHHQGVALEVSCFPYADALDLVALADQRRTVLALDGIVDPRNLGALLRTAEAAGIRHVVVPQDRSAAVTPLVAAASAGASEHLAILREVNLVRWLQRAKHSGFWVVGLALDPRSQPLFESELRPPLVLVVGAEGTGLRRLTREACDLLVSIPMYGQVESLNAAVAGALAMYEVQRWLDDADVAPREA